MVCVKCRRDITNDAAFCLFCGTAQGTPTASVRYLRRSRIERQIAGVCGGIARYFEVDPVLVRAAWVLLTLVPGVIFLGVMAYLVTWLIVPEAETDTAPGETTAKESDVSQRGKRLRRSATDRNIGGVCGGLAEYFYADSAVIRFLWVGLTIFPGAIVYGVVDYIIAWFIMPTDLHVPTPTEQATASDDTP